jgi:membrane-associated phospholipid phosphatase
MAAATLVAAAIFLAYPTTVLRDDDLAQNATSFMRSLLKLMDVRTNWFPSLHVALATLATRAVPVGRWRRIAVLWAAAICLSTLTTRQHVFVDVVGGLALAGATWAIAARLPVAARPSPAMQLAKVKRARGAGTSADCG